MYGTPVYCIISAAADEEAAAAEGSGSGSRPTLGRMSTSSSAPDLQKLAAEGGARADGAAADGTSNPEPDIQRLSAGDMPAERLPTCSPCFSPVPSGLSVVHLVSSRLSMSLVLSSHCTTTVAVDNHERAVLLNVREPCQPWRSRRRHNRRYRGPRRRHVRGSDCAAAAAGAHRAAVPAAGARRRHSHGETSLGPFHSELREHNLRGCGLAEI